MELAQIELLVIDAKQGDKAAFTQLCRYFHPSLLRYSYKLCNDVQLAHDAVQNSWIKITKSILKIEDPRAFRSWIYQSVKWQTLDLIRKDQRDKQRLSEIDVDELSADEDKNNSGYLLAHIAELSDIDKQAIHLFYLDNMSIEEISIVLEVPIGTVKSRLYRARQMLKDKMRRINHEH